jgi:hypothetical protein
MISHAHILITVLYEKILLKFQWKINFLQGQMLPRRLKMIKSSQVISRVSYLKIIDVSGTVSGRACSTNVGEEKRI